MPKPLLWSLRLLAVALFAGVLTWHVARRQQQVNPGVVAEAKAPLPSPAPVASSTPRSSSGAATVPNSLATTYGALSGVALRPEWKCNQNRQAVVFGARLIGPQEVAPAPTFIPSSKVGILSRFQEVDADFLAEFGVDLDMTVPPAKAGDAPAPSAK